MSNCSLLNKLKRIIALMLFLTSANTYAQDLLIPFKDASGKYGYNNEDGKLVISPRYVAAEYWADDFYRVTEVGQKVAHSAFGISAISMENPKWGYLDEKGKLAIPLIYARAFDFKNGVACVSVDGKNYGLIDSKGKSLTAMKYTMPMAESTSERTWDFKKGPALVKTGGGSSELYGFIDKQGKEVVTPKYKNAQKFEDGMAAVMLNDKWGFINTSGKLVIDYQFEDGMTSFLYNFKDGQAHVKKGDKYIFIDKTGTQLEESFMSRVYSVLKAGAEGFKDGYGPLLKEDASNKMKYYQPKITLNGQVEAIAVLDAQRIFTTTYDPLQNPNIATYKATILEVLNELGAGKGDRSVTMLTDKYVFRTLDDKGAKVYVLNLLPKGIVVAALIEKPGGLEFRVVGR